MATEPRAAYGSAWLDVELPPPGPPITEIPQELLGYPR